MIFKAIIGSCLLAILVILVVVTHRSTREEKDATVDLVKIQTQLECDKKMIAQQQERLDEYKNEWRKLLADTAFTLKHTLIFYNYTRGAAEWRRLLTNQVGIYEGVLVNLHPNGTIDEAECAACLLPKQLCGKTFTDQTKGHAISVTCRQEEIKGDKITIIQVQKKVLESKHPTPRRFPNRDIKRLAVSGFPPKRLVFITRGLFPVVWS